MLTNSLIEDTITKYIYRKNESICDCHTINSCATGIIKDI